jgi:hypothetical protein
MKKRQREAVLVELAQAMRDEGSWCGETHIQKATYVLEELLEVPLGFDHVLYKYGPFGSDVRDELATMRADGFLESQSAYPYGPRLASTEAASDQLLKKWPKTVKRYEPHVRFVAQRFNSKGVGELERLATALWVRREMPSATRQAQAFRLREIKPHVSLEAGEKTLEEVASWEQQAARLLAKESSF